MPLLDNPEFDEYFKRIAQTRRDLDKFQEDLSEVTKVRPFVILEYGDHQPGIMNAFWQQKLGKNAISDLNSPAYTNYFQIRTEGNVNGRSAELPESIDLVFLAPTLLENAGIPLSPVQDFLVRMRDECSGKFSECGPDWRARYYECRRWPEMCTDTGKPDLTVSMGRPLENTSTWR